MISACFAVLLIGVVPSARATFVGRDGDLLILRPPAGGSDLGELWLSGPQGQRPHKILTCTCSFLSAHAEFSPSGRQIAFVENSFSVARQSYDHLLVVVNVTGAGERVLRRFSDSSPRSTPLIHGPNGFAFSPDGQEVAYAYVILDRTGFKTKVVFLNVSKPRITHSITLSGDLSGPVWSSTGQLFFVDSAGTVEVTRANGSHRHAINIAFPAPASTATSIPTFAYDEPPIAPSPNGSQLAVTGQASDSTTDVYLVAAAGGRARRLTHGGSGDFPVWSPDGRQIELGNESEVLTPATGRVSKLKTPTQGLVADWQAVPK